jgi:hypothetical protein
MWRNIKWNIPSDHSYLNHFEETSSLNGYFALPFPSYLIAGYVKYIRYVKNIIVLSHDLTIFSGISITPHNFKY